GDGASDARAAIAPGHRPAATVPVRTVHNVVAVGKKLNAVISQTICGTGADQAVGFGDDTGNTRAAIAPGHRSAEAVPRRTVDHIVAVAQGKDAEATHLISEVGADETVGFGNGAAKRHGAIAPSHRPPLAIPTGTVDYIVAV